MNTTPKKTAVLVRCMDKRHADQIIKSLKKVVGDYDVYELTEPGGAGLFADLQSASATQWLVDKIKLTVDHLHVQEIFLAIHGSSDEDPKGCGGYALGGFADKYKDSETSRKFSHEQLKKAAAFVKNKFPTIPVKSFYITFSTSGENKIEKVEEV